MFAIVTVKHINTNELKYINCVFKLYYDIWVKILNINLVVDLGSKNENTKYILIRTVADVIFYIVAVLIFLF